MFMSWILLGLTSVAGADEDGALTKVVAERKEAILSAITQLSDIDERKKRHRELKAKAVRTADDVIALREAEANVLSDLQKELACVRFLGEIRADEGVDVLLNRIDVTFDLDKVRPEDHKRDKDVVVALTRIGKPASRGAVGCIAKDTSRDRMLLYLRVIVLVEGIDVGKQMLRLAMESEKDPQRKERLKSAAELIKNAERPIP